MKSSRNNWRSLSRLVDTVYNFVVVKLSFFESHISNTFTFNDLLRAQLAMGEREGG